MGFGLAGALLAVLTTYYFIYNPEVYENSRFIESFSQPLEAAKDDEKKTAALLTLQKKGLEWAHYQFVDAIQSQDIEVIGLYVDAGMVLKDRSAIVGQMMENPARWVALVERLGWDNQKSLSGLFDVPRHLDDMDSYFKIVELRYAIPHDVTFKDHYLRYKVVEDKWINAKQLEIEGVHKMCDGDTRCNAVNIPVIHIEYEKSKPIAPEKDLILWQEPQLTLMSAAILLDNQPAIDYLEQKNVVDRVNRMVMSDRIIVVFEVAEDKTISYPEGVTVKKLKRVKTPAERQTE